MQDYNNLHVLLKRQLHSSHIEDNNRNNRAVVVIKSQPYLSGTDLPDKLAPSGSLGCKKSAPVSSGPGGRHQQNAPVWTQHHWPTGVWNPDLTGDQELNNLVSRDSNFMSSPQILQITDSTAHHQIQSAHHKWSPVWVNNNYEWSCWFDLLWKFIWTFKQFLHTLVIVHFQWIQHLLLPLLEKLKKLTVFCCQCSSELASNTIQLVCYDFQEVFI